MSTNRPHQPLTSSRRLLDDAAGMAAIIVTAVAVAVIVGVGSVAFPVILFAALAALAVGEQRLSAGTVERSPRPATASHARA